MSKITIKQTRKHSLVSMKSVYNDEKLHRKTMEEYKQFTKEELLKSMHAFLNNYDRNRRTCVELQLQNNYLNRTIMLLKKRVEQLSISKHCFVSDKYYENQKKNKWNHPKKSTNILLKQEELYTNPKYDSDPDYRCPICEHIIFKGETIIKTILGDIHSGCDNGEGKNKLALKINEMKKNN